VTALLDHLQRFNRKERFLLVGQALGNPTFTLGKHFAGSLADKLARPVPQTAYCAMDYHLDWLFAALVWTYEGGGIGMPMPRTFTDPKPVSGDKDDWKSEDLKVTGNQSDVDLLVAWVDDRGRGQVVMLEAKGYSRWDPEQMRYKCARLNAIFGSDGRRFSDVDAHLVLTGPAPGPTATSLPDMQWPIWARQQDAPDGPAKYFLPLTKPGHETVAVERITAPEDGPTKKSATGSYWRIKDAKWPSTEEAVESGT